jgi:FkbH-like protein
MDGLFARARRLTKPGADADPTLPTDLIGAPDTAVVREAGRLLAKVPARLTGPPGRRFRKQRIAVASSFTCDGVPPFLRISLLDAGIDGDLQTTGADQLMVELTRPDSALARFAPDITLVLVDEGMFWPADWDPTDLPGLRDAMTERLAMLGAALAAYTARTCGSVLLHTVPLPPHRLRSVIAYQSRATVSRAWRELNLGLLDLAAELDAVHVMDLESLLVDHPGVLRDDRLHRFAVMAWSPSVERLYAQEAARFCRAAAGLSAKCLVLDLDNTLWGGVLGDDGPENIEVGNLYPGNAFVETQRTALALRRQGVLLAISSKNDPALVRKVFDEHPGLVLRRPDFAATAVNWEPKDGNVAALAAELNIGLDSVVFADDSRFERELVGHSLPDVTLVDLSGDPAGHAARLVGAASFDVLATTATDQNRTELYHARRERQEWAATQTGSGQDYLAGLDLRVSLRPANAYTLPRIHQLGTRTNQFSLVPQAHSQTRTREMAESPADIVLGFEVSDRFGPEGISGAVWISRAADHWLIENYVLSCRVFSRGIEFAVLQALVDDALAERVPRLEAVFQPTERNGPARGFLDAAGFVPGHPVGGRQRYVLPLDPVPAIGPDWITLRRDDDA